jgi:1,4-dihydroxy-2-naphthoate octaprenyltransferase
MNDDNKREQDEQRIRGFLQSSQVAVIATSAGEDLRLRTMHLGFEDDFAIYLATMHGDPKVIQMTHNPSVAIMVNKLPGDVTESEEVEYTGRAMIIRDPVEREKCLRSTQKTSPIVQALTAQGNTEVLDCIKIVPQLIKYRKFKEIVQGMPPTVLEFPQYSQVVSDWSRLETRLKSWWVAFRPNSLVAALVPVVLGAALTWQHTGTFLPVWFLLTLLGAGLLQVGTNLFNDYHDHRTGADNANRTFIRPFNGGSRVIQLGLLTPLDMLEGGIAACGVALGLAVYFAASGRPAVVLLALIGALSGWLYNKSGWNFIRGGVGELITALNFGSLIALGTWYVQTGTLSWLPVVVALPVTLLITAVLYINQFQDDAADRRMGKVTAVVRLGRERAARLFPVFFVLSYVILLGLVALRLAPVATLLALLSLPVAWPAVAGALRDYGDNIDLAPANGFTALTHLFFGLMQALGYLTPAGLGPTIVFGLVFVAITVYLYRWTERMRLASVGVKQAMSR